MRNLYLVFFVVLSCISIGCLGVGSRGVDTGADYVPRIDAPLSGRAYFAEQRLYGGIPIAAKSVVSDQIAKIVHTDPSGNFAFTELPDGLYDILALTGESEVLFARSVQVQSNTPRQLPEASLLGVRDAIIFDISSDSFKLKFRTNRRAAATIDYAPGGNDFGKINLDRALTHETKVTGLRPRTMYGVVLSLSDEEGQEFIMRGLYATTIGSTGPQNISVSINEGDFETTSPNVTLYLRAHNASEMRISETEEGLSEAHWESFTQIRPYSFSSSSPGTKRIYAQFRNDTGNLSPVQNARILLNQTGYLGIWIEDGAGLTNKSEVAIRIVYPGATQMLISENIEFLNSYWEPYTEYRTWRLRSGDGIKTIYGKFRGPGINSDEIFMAAIELVTIPPEVEMLINGGTKYTATTSVQLTFSASPLPTQMKVSLEQPPSSDIRWIAYETPYSLKLEAGDGEKTVYGLFRDAAGNEFGPISAVIELDTLPPVGNTFAIRASDDPGSEEIDYTLTASLPVYLHFDIADEITEKAGYALTDRSLVDEPSEYQWIEQPFIPHRFDANNFPVGRHRIWVKFTDFAGNTTYTQRSLIEHFGPNVIIEPKTATLYSGRNRQFVATPENLGGEDYGIIRWRVVQGSGVIDQTGLYTATAPVYVPETVTIRAEFTDKSDLFGTAQVQLATRPEILFSEVGNNFAYEVDDIVVGPGEWATATVKILHGSQGAALSRPLQVSEGQMRIGTDTTSEFGITNLLSYRAPNITPEQNPVQIQMRAVQDSSITGTISFLIAEGANITLSPAAGEAQRHRPLEVTANVINTASQTMTWTLDPSSFGSFSASDPSVATITSIDPAHRVRFFPSTVTQRQVGKIIATIDNATKSAVITVLPPISFVVSPEEVTALPVIAPIEFKAEGFENIEGSTDEVTWEFRNFNRTDGEYSPASEDTQTFQDRGSLTVTGPTTAEYHRPSVPPGLRDASDADVVIIRATSVADPLASATAIVNITPNVEVKIYRDVSKQTLATQAATVAEVGKIRFYAGVTPTAISDQSVTWTVNGTAGDDRYGFIDGFGLYQAPDVITDTEVTVRATSNYDPSAHSEVRVRLSDFWADRRGRMIDSQSGTPMPISSLLVDPNTSVGEDFIVYAGTLGYGVWVATFSDEVGSTAGGYWQPVPGLHSWTESNAGEMTINRLAFSRDRQIYIVTQNGLWRMQAPPDLNAGPSTAVKLTLSGEVANENKFLDIAFDRTNQNNVTYLASPRGIYRMQKDVNNIYTGSVLVINTYHGHRIQETRTYEVPGPGTETVQLEEVAYSNELQPNPINAVMYAVAFDGFSDRLYAGGERSNVVLARDSQSPNLILTTDKQFVAPAPSADTEIRTQYRLSTTQPVIIQVNPQILLLVRDIAIDPVNNHTLWAATAGGVYRSISNGEAWAASDFGTGSNVNTRAIIVDPTNTINVMAGSEDGLYRTTDAGGSWIRIKSGLGEHKTVTSLTQAPGMAGVRRKVWVGTSGGVFIGRQSLDLE